MEKMSLKAFWEAVEQRLAGCSSDELRDILLAMAQETPPSGRQAFLAKLKPRAAAVDAVREAAAQEDLLADIDDLASEIKDAVENAEYEDHDYYGWGEYDEEDSLGPYEDFVEPLSDLFDRAQAVFDLGELELAGEAYQRLFEMLTLEDDYGRGISGSDLAGVDVGEERARYLRAVYETEPVQRRPQALFELMRRVQRGAGLSRPTFDEIIQISPRPLPDQERFMPAWIAFLRQQADAEADALLREAIRLSAGTAGLEELARTEGLKRPLAYLDWCAALAKEGQQREVLAAAQEALGALPQGLAVRAAIADHLYAAAAHLEKPEAMREGRWEAFAAQSTLPRLLDLWEIVPAGEEHAILVRQAAQYMAKHFASSPRRRGSELDEIESQIWVDKAVLTHAYLLSGDWNAAYQVAVGERVLGWSSSSNSQGLVVAFFLVLLSGQSPQALSPNLAQTWRAGLQNSISFYESKTSEGQGPTFKRLDHIYAQVIPGLSLSSAEQQQMLSWCLDMAQKRVEAIVGAQHRKSYGKAAVLTVACVEVLRARGKSGEANAMLDTVRNRFPRHRAFQSDLRAAVQLMERQSKTR
jgi:hypothetical protein